jgi:HSP20 family protein
MPATGIALVTEPETSIQAEEPAPFIEEVTNLYDRIASRAFEIFEGNGGLGGHDLDNWLRAEAEFFHPLHIGVSESPEAFTVRADVPGFGEKDLEIDVEPRRVTIAGKRETTKQSNGKKTIYAETCSDQILRVVDLPAAVVAKKMKTTVKDGVLELNLAKAEPDKQSETKS